MIDVKEARRRVEEYLRNSLRRSAHDIVVVDEHTRHEDFGWVFFYNTRAYVELGDKRHALVGNAPLIVDRDTGEIHMTGTALPTEHYLQHYRQSRRSRT